MRGLVIPEAAGPVTKPTSAATRDTDLSCGPPTEAGRLATCRMIAVGLIQTVPAGHFDDWCRRVRLTPRGGPHGPTRWAAMGKRGRSPMGHAGRGGAGRRRDLAGGSPSG